MNAIADLMRPHTHISARARRGLGKETFVTRRTIELTGDHGCYAQLRCEIEFYREFDEILQCDDEPYSPPQYDIASIRVFEYGRMETGMSDTTPRYLETPAYLEELLVACVDLDSLEESN